MPADLAASVAWLAALVLALVAEAALGRRIGDWFCGLVDRAMHEQHEYTSGGAQS